MKTSKPGAPGVISFRCWYCTRAYHKPKEKVGEEFTCSCEHRLRVPRRSGGPCRVKSLTDRLVEAVVYGGAGAIVGFLLGFIIATKVPVFGIRQDYTGAAVTFVAGMTLFGFLLGVLVGEGGVGFLGRFLGPRDKT